MSDHEELERRRHKFYERLRKERIKDDLLVKYVVEHHVLPVEKLCEILNCDIEDIMGEEYELQRSPETSETSG